MAELKPANENPWYVLMTLYGEQEREEVDQALHARNQEAWNLWAGQALSEVERAKLAERGFVLPEQTLWEGRRDQIMAGHREAMIVRNRTEFDYPGFPEPSQRIDFDGVYFAQLVVAGRFLFPVDSRFLSAIFSGAAVFDNATFSKAAEFGSATFSGQAWFLATTFSGAAVFDSAKFSEAAGFGSATFSGETSFASARFSGEAWFASARFSGEASFASATFSETAWFYSATFSEEARFFSATFSGTAWFSTATFSGFAYFIESKFGVAGQAAEVGFDNCQFLKPISFREAVFHSRYPFFDGAMLHDKTRFPAEAGSWPQSKEYNPLQAKASCAVMRQVMGKQELPEEAHFFFRREMGFATEIGGFWQRLPYRLFGWFSDFGYEIARPCLWGLLLLIGSAFAFFFGADMVTGIYGSDALAFGTALTLSFSNIFNFLGLQRTYFDAQFLLGLPWPLKLLSGFETLAGVVLLFFLGLGLRTRFRLR